jgi:hypothetical protein
VICDGPQDFEPGGDGTIGEAVAVVDVEVDHHRRSAECLGLRMPVSGNSSASITTFVRRSEKDRYVTGWMVVGGVEFII